MSPNIDRCERKSISRRASKLMNFLRDRIERLINASDCRFVRKSSGQHVRKYFIDFDIYDGDNKHFFETIILLYKRFVVDIHKLMSKTNRTYTNVFRKNGFPNGLII